MVLQCCILVERYVLPYKIRRIRVVLLQYRCVRMYVVGHVVTFPEKSIPSCARHGQNHAMTLHMYNVVYTCMFVSDAVLTGMSLLCVQKHLESPGYYALLFWD
jgi:hypothetical protein